MSDFTGTAGAILVLGGSGFVGSHLIKRLVASGEKRIINIDIKPPRHPVEGVEYRNMDVKNMGNLVLNERVKLIYNFAAIHTTPGHETHEYYETNIAGALELVKFAERTGVPEIVFTSSISVYGPGEDQKTEDSVLAPVSAYGYSKMIAEKVHVGWLERHSDHKLTIVRPAVVFGSGEGGNFTRLANLLRKGFFVYPGRRDTIKSCISVYDLLDAIEFARGRNSAYVVFNGAYPQRYSLENIINSFTSKYFPDARVVTISEKFVLMAARFAGALNMFNIGIHPERVLKLMRSTNVYPTWLVEQGMDYPNALERALSRWHSETNGKFN